MSKINAKIEDLDWLAIDYFLKKGYENGRITNEERNLPVEMLLQNLDLMNEDGKLKNAALLLFAKRPQKYFTGVRFQIGRFGADEADLMFQDIIEGNIKAGFIDAWGRGYKKIREGFEGAGLPMPKVENFCGGVRVTFQRGLDVVTGKKIVHSDVHSNVHSNGGNIGGDIPLFELTKIQNYIIDLIRADDSISVNQMAVKMAVKKRTLEREIANMKQKGYISRTGSPRNGRWEVNIPLDCIIENV